MLKKSGITLFVVALGLAVITFCSSRREPSERWLRSGLRIRMPSFSFSSVVPPETHFIAKEKTEKRVDASDPPPEFPVIPHFSKARLVSWIDLPQDSRGTVERVEILNTDFKYPLVRMTLQRVLDPHGNTVAIRGQQLMVADHVNIQKTSGLSEEEFAASVERAGGTGIKRIGNTSVYTISFDGHDPMAVPKMMEKLKRQGAGAAEPDYIRTI